MRSNETGGNVPAFLYKLLQLVDSPDTDHLISWSPGGKSFVIQNPGEFSKELLPLFFKHNNMASFIRQLNMYGFHKVLSMENGSLKCDKDEMKFTHPYFVQGDPSLLQHIKRKIAYPKVFNSDEQKPELITKVISDVKQMKGRQESMDARFSVMKQENEALWREVAVLRQKHMKQQQIVNNLIQFLMSLVQPTRNASHNPGVKRKYQLMLNSAAHLEDQPGERSLKQAKLGDHHVDSDNIVEYGDCGPVIHELADHDVVLGEDANNGVNPRYIKVEVPSLSPRPVVSSPLSNVFDADVMSPVSPLIPQEPILADSISEDAIDPAVLMLNNKNLQNLSEETSRPETYLVPTNSENQFNITVTPAGSENNNIALIKGKNTSKSKSTNQPTYSVPATPILPNNIFAEDESLNDVTPVLQDNCQDATSFLQNAAEEYVNSSAPPSNNQEVSEQIANIANYLSNIPSGNYGFASNSLGADQKSNDKKTKWRNKKKMNANESTSIANKTTTDLNKNSETQSQDNMTLVSVDNRDKLPLTVPRRDYTGLLNQDLRLQNGGSFKKNDVDDHLDIMQNDLDNLREILRGDSYSLDANALLGLFGQDDPFYGLSMNPEDHNLNKGKEGSSDAEQSGQLIWYVPPNQVLDFADMNLIDGNQENELDSIPETFSPLTGDLSALNTPQVEMGPPLYKRKVV